MYKIILTAAEKTSAKSVFEGTNPQDLITEDWDTADGSVSNGLLMEDLVDQNIQRTCRSMEHSVHGISTTQYNVISY